MSTIEVVITLLVIGVLALIAFVIYQLFQQTEVVGAIKWAALLIALTTGGTASSRRST